MKEYIKTQLEANSFKQLEGIENIYYNKEKDIKAVYFEKTEKLKFYNSEDKLIPDGKLDFQIK